MRMYCAFLAGLLGLRIVVCAALTCGSGCLTSDMATISRAVRLPYRQLFHLMLPIATVMHSGHTTQCVLAFLAMREITGGYLGQHGQQRQGGRQSSDQTSGDKVCSRM